MVADVYSELEPTVLASPILAPIIDLWDVLALPDCWVAAGAVAQTIWNRKFGLSPTHGIVDVDIIYFDPIDLTENAEARHAERVCSAFVGVPVRIDVKNEARVHLWYAEKFGRQIAPYNSATDAIASFPTTATAIGLKPSGSSLLLNAPFGIQDLMNGIVRANKRQITSEIYNAKVERWTAIWSGLTVIPW